MLYQLFATRDVVANTVSPSTFVPTGKGCPTEGMLTLSATGTPDATLTIRSRQHPSDPFNVLVVEITEVDLDANGAFDLPVKLSHEWQAEISSWVDGEWNAYLKA